MSKNKANRSQASQTSIINQQAQSNSGCIKGCSNISTEQNRGQCISK
ncbi:hypothetical protein COLO4_36807 [Corchorus olitorius]|uniref:Uncharacterized protein n=1 Tax=Corchorus olitorius TaxID=93759 RepID=A0A1R3G5B1_9ROSI|nr:hypothetical protein COLO4_36807 [Corchorus olitorius]